MWRKSQAPAQDERVRVSADEGIDYDIVHNYCTAPQCSIDWLASITKKIRIAAL